MGTKLVTRKEKTFLGLGLKQDQPNLKLPQQPCSQNQTEVETQAEQHTGTLTQGQVLQGASRALLVTVPGPVRQNHREGETVLVLAN